MDRLEGARYVVRAVTRGERRRAPAPPFITSTLQQEAGRKLGFTARKTMTWPNSSTRVSISAGKGRWV